MAGQGHRYSYRVNVYNSQIHGLFMPGGEVNDWTSDITTKVKARAIIKSATFNRSGHLTASHRRSVVPSGIYGVRGYVENTASYALYKHNGTAENGAGYIYPTRKKRLKLKTGNGYRASYQRRVSGQVGDPWLLEAGNEVLLRYGIRASPAL